MARRLGLSPVFLQGSFQRESCSEDEHARSKTFPMNLVFVISRDIFMKGIYIFAYGWKGYGPYALESYLLLVAWRAEHAIFFINGAYHQLQSWSLSG